MAPFNKADSKELEAKYDVALNSLIMLAHPRAPLQSALLLPTFPFNYEPPLRPQSPISLSEILASPFPSPTRLNSKRPTDRLKRFVSLGDDVIDTPDPNLELHSAAASGNVGLVHYALTHGQPVNSVLHGVLPLHAACSGGSVSVVRMLIERGADVNAPRLPRRYSDGRKSNAPSVGAAGSTPLHFAAANGHSPIVQILLTCGAIPDKPDKNGMTPEALAEINGHTDVIRVLRVWEHLKLQEQQSNSSFAAISNLPSPSLSSVMLDEDNLSVMSAKSSRKGKERSMSFASNTSGTSQKLRVKKSLEGFFKTRGSRSGSVASKASDTSPVSLQIGAGGSTSQLDNMVSPVDIVSPVSPSPNGGLDLPLDDAIAPLITLQPPPTNRNNPTTAASRRPSLPSIFEKAAHPGQAFRNALHMARSPEHKTHFSPPTSPTEYNSTSPPRSGSSGSSSFFRGRTRSNESSGAGKSRKYMSKHALLHLFRRSDSPPSRSPSPPLRKDSDKIFAAEEIDDGIEKLRRASLDLDIRQGLVTPEGVELGEEERLPPASAPATKTKFFPDDPDAPPVPALDRSVLGWNRSRQNSEVMAPSPLANEWQRDSDSDSAQQHAIRRSRTELIRSQTSSPRNSRPSSPQGITKPRSSTLPSVPRQRIFGLDWAEQFDLHNITSAPGEYDEAEQVEDNPHSGYADAVYGRSDHEGDGEDTEREEILDDDGDETEGEPDEFHDASQDVIDLVGLYERQTVSMNISKGSPLRDIPKVYIAEPEAVDELYDESTAVPAEVLVEEPRIVERPISKDGVPAEVAMEEQTDTESAGALDETVSLLEAPVDADEGGYHTALESSRGGTPEPRIAQIKRSLDSLRGVAISKSPLSSVAGPSLESLTSTPLPVEPDLTPSETTSSPAPNSIEGKTESQGSAKPADSVAQSSKPTSPPKERVTSPTPYGSRFVEGFVDFSNEPAEPPQRSPSRWQRRFRGTHRNPPASRAVSNTPTTLTLSSIRDEVETPPPPQPLAVPPPGIELPKPSRVSAIKNEELQVEPKPVPPPPPPSIVSVDNRSRNISVSSGSSAPSASATYSSYVQTSTPGTSLTPPSILSISLGSGFPPVPEDEVAHSPQLSRRKISSRAEARDLVKQTEDDIMQLAQLPPSLDSSRSLAAQLAAYGDSHALEQEFVEREMLERRNTNLGNGSDDGGSFVSAKSSASSSAASKSKPPSLYSVNHPDTSVPNINIIYDKRAAEYRKRMEALVAIPPAFPTTPSSARTRPRSRTGSSTPSGPWVPGGPSHRTVSDSRINVDRQPNPSSPLAEHHAGSSKPRPRAPSRSSQNSFTAGSSFQGSMSPMTRYHSTTSNINAPAPIAGVLSTRFQGMSPPPGAVGSAGPSTGSPYISIFSSRYSGHPHDGDESDDEEHGQRNYTLIENDWRGGHVVDPNLAEGLRKKGRWGQIKGAVGHLGRK